MNFCKIFAKVHLSYRTHSRTHFYLTFIPLILTKLIYRNKIVRTFYYTVDTRYLEYPLSQTFTMSNFLFRLFSIPINFPYNSVRYVELRYPELSLCQTMFSVPSVIFGISPIRSHSQYHSFE